MIEYSKREFFYKDSCHKSWVITATRNGSTIATINNSILQEESITLTESIGSSDDFVLGRCEPSKFEFTVHNIIEPLKNCTVTVDLILDHDITAPFRVGTYYVDSDKPTANRDFRKVTCYDMAGKLAETEVVDWYKNLTFPMTLKNFRNSFFSFVGITQENITLPQDNILVYNSMDEEETEEGDESSRNVENYSISAMTVLNAICQINGSFGHITRDNKFRYVYLPTIIKGLYPADDLYPDNNLYPSEDVVNGTFYKKYYESCEYEDFETKLIDGVIIPDEEGNISVRTSENLYNPYKLEGNFLLYKMSREEMQTVANNLYSKISTIQYSPCKINCVADLCIEVGDSFVFNDKYNAVYSYIFTRTMSGLQVLKDEFESRGNEDLSKNLNSVSAQLQRLRDKAEFDIDVAKARIDYLQVKEGNFEILTAQNFQATRIYAEQIGSEAQRVSKIYADQVGDETYRVSKVYADQVTANTLLVSQAYADRIGANTLSAAQIYAQQIGTETERVSKIYADQIGSEAQRVSKIYADQIGDAANRVSKGYYDTLHAELISVDNIKASHAEVSNAEGSAKLYADNVASNTLSTAQLYADSVGSDAKRVAKGYYDDLNSKKLTTSSLSSTIASLSRVTVNSLHSNSGISSSGIISCPYLSVANRDCSWTNITINGTTYTVMTGD